MRAPVSILTGALITFQLRGLPRAGSLNSALRIATAAQRVRAAHAGKSGGEQRHGDRLGNRGDLENHVVVVVVAEGARIAVFHSNVVRVTDAEERMLLQRRA